MIYKFRKSEKLQASFRLKKNVVFIYIWARSWDYGTYHIGHQRRLRRACASVQSRQSLRCSHTWSNEVDEGSDQKSGTYPHWMAAHGRLKSEFMEDEKCHKLISWLIYSIHCKLICIVGSSIQSSEEQIKEGIWFLSVPCRGKAILINTHNMFL